MKRKHLITKQDCYNKRKKLGRNTSRHAEDAVSVDLLVNELQKEKYNPILLYKPQGIVDPNMPVPQDRFVLALQTEFQQNMYQQYASSVICIDSTHKTNVYDFKLVTLMVVDQYGEGKLNLCGVLILLLHKHFTGIPVAWLIADREDSVTMASFLNAVKLRSPTTSINTAMTDDGMNPWEFSGP